MRITQTLKVALLGIALLMAVTAFASNKGSISFLEDLTVGNQTLKAGDYSFRWDGNGPNIQLNIVQGSKVVATTPARLVESNRPFNNDAAITTTNSDGSKSLAGLELAGKKFTIEIGQEAAADGTK